VNGSNSLSADLGFNLDFVTSGMGLSDTAKGYLMECKGRHAINQSKTCLKVVIEFSFSSLNIASVTTQNPLVNSTPLRTLELLF